MQGSLRRVLQTAVCKNCSWQEVFASVRHNSNKASVGRVNRISYVRSYPTMVVMANGSTINIRYKEPRKIIKLPLDLSTLTIAEREAHLKKRKPKAKIVIEEDIEDDFDADHYSHLWKKK